jgi:hypothetical protein
MNRQSESNDDGEALPLANDNDLCKSSKTFTLSYTLSHLWMSNIRILTKIIYIK